MRPIAANESICPMCEMPAVGGYTHPRCQTRYSLDGLTSFFHYDGPVRKAIKEIKYRLVSDVSEEFIGLIPATGFHNYVLVPVPLHPKRFRERGFNQAEALGRLMAEKLHIPMRPDILSRARATTPQVEMKDKKKRLENMRNVFSVHNSLFRNHNSCILLFDDVFTTGATMRSAANVLKRAGASRVWAVTIAR